MTISYLFLDGFDHYNTEVFLGQKWSADGSFSSGIPTDGRLGTGFTFETGANRRGAAGNSLGIPSGAGIRRRVANSGGQYLAGQVGAAVSRSAATSREIFLICGDNTSPAYQQAAKLRWNADGSFSIIDKNNTVVFTSTVVAPMSDHYYYVEFSIQAQGTSTTTGSAFISVDGIQVGSVSGVDFSLGGSLKSLTAFAICASDYSTASTGPTIYVDDVYFANPNPVPSFLGPMAIQTLAPTGTGGYAQWVGSDGNSVNNYQLVDESPPDTSDFVSASANNDTDSYTIPAPSGVGTPQVTQFNALAKRGPSGVSKFYFVTATAGATTSTSNYPVKNESSSSDAVIPTSLCLLRQIGPANLTGLDAGVRAVT